MNKTSLQSLFIRNLIFTILQPGMVAGLIPYLIVKPILGGYIYLKFHSYIGIICFIAGFIITLHCIIRFMLDGQGTLSPADPTKKLVISGLYRYSRNPMYVGVILLLIGEAIFFTSIPLSIYAVAIFIAFSIFIYFFEEPRLKKDFGQEYIMYCKKVRRWI